MKKLLLLLFIHLPLFTMIVKPSLAKECIVDVQGHSIQIRHNAEQQFIFASFVSENPSIFTCLSKDLKTNKLFPRTRYLYYSDDRREIYLHGELDKERVALLEAAIDKFEKK